MNTDELKSFWSNRYSNENTGWDIGTPSTPLKSYFDQLPTKNISILIPGAGNAYEAEYLNSLGFRNVYVLDIAPEPLNNLQQRVPNFPKDHLICENFFEHKGEYDLIIEQTFFCSFEPSPANRSRYAKKMHELLRLKGKLVGLWFDIPLAPDGNRPYGGTKEEYLQYFSAHFHIKSFEACYNSIKPRSGNELFGIFIKKINRN